MTRSLEEASMDLGADSVQTFRLRHLPHPALGPAGRRPARLRPLLRRDHRHHLHRRSRRPDPPHLDLHQPHPPQPGPHRQRGRGPPGPDLGRADLVRPAPVGRHSPRRCRRSRAVSADSCPATPRRTGRRTARHPRWRAGGPSTEGDGELVEEADLAEQDLPGGGSPLIEEPDLSAPFPTRETRLRRQPEGHLGGMHQSCLPADLQRGRIIAIRCHPDLSGDPGRGQHPLRAGVDQRIEGRLLRPFWPVGTDEGDTHHRPVDESALGCVAPLVGSSWYGKTRGRDAVGQRRGYPRPTSSASCSCSVGTRRTLASRIRLERSCLNSASELLAAATTSLPLRATHFPSSPRRISARRGGSTALPRSVPV